MNDNKLELKSYFFKGNEIRSVCINEEEYYFSMVDIINVLTNSKVPRKYWSVLKGKLKKENNEVIKNCIQLKMLAPDGKVRVRDAMKTADILKLIDTVPSLKSNSFKLWMTNLNEKVNKTVI